MKNKPDWYYNQSAVVPFKVKNNKIFVLIITSRKKKKWIVPKGIVEIDMTPQESAKKEAFEEAGVEGSVNGELLGTYEYEKWGGECKVDVYPMEVEKEHNSWSEDHFRDRKWVALHDALKVIKPKQLANVVGRLEELIKHE